MDRISIILKKKKMTPGLHLLLYWDYFLQIKHVYWYIQQISGESLQDHWSSGFFGYTFEPLRKKIGLQVFQPDLTQAGLYNHSRRLEG